MIDTGKNGLEGVLRVSVACPALTPNLDFQAPATQARLSIEFQFLLTCTFILKMLYTTYNLGAYLMLCGVSQKCYAQRNCTRAPVVQRLDYAIHWKNTYIQWITQSVSLILNIPWIVIIKCIALSNIWTTGARTKLTSIRTSQLNKQEGKPNSEKKMDGTLS